MRLIDCGVVLVCSALGDVVRSVVAYWILGVKAVVLPLVNLYRGLTESCIAVAVLVLA